MPIPCCDGSDASSQLRSMHIVGRVDVCNWPQPVCHLPPLMRQESRRNREDRQHTIPPFGAGNRCRCKRWRIFVRGRFDRCGDCMVEGCSGGLPCRWRRRRTMPSWMDSGGLERSCLPLFLLLREEWKGDRSNRCGQRGEERQR